MTLADIPPEIGLFPLGGALMLPRGKLPLNIFEPRYLALFQDALASNRLVGMVQPRDDDDETELYRIGCIGRITSFTERSDGTYAVTLSGIARFRLLRESGIQAGYRLGRIDCSSYADDLIEPDVPQFDRTRLIESLRNYFQLRGLSTRWALIEQMEDEMLLVTLPMISPFPNEQKQLLLEARSLDDRARVLLSMLEGNDSP